MINDTEVIPPGASHPQALHVLAKKHAEIAGLIRQARMKVQLLTADLHHIEASIRLLDPSIEVSRIRAKHIPVHEPAARGEVTGILLDILRDSTEPLAPRQLTRELMIRRCMNPDNKELFETLLKRVRATLRAQRARGAIQPVALSGDTQLWGIQT